MYDIMGDIHGHAQALKELLRKMDYKELNGVWQHSTRKIIFVGDYIDRGPAIRETLNIVRTMKENSHAITLMGNHNITHLLMLTACLMIHTCALITLKIINNMKQH